MLDYVATCPNGGIFYCKRRTQLAAHSDAGYLNKKQTRSRESTKIYLSEHVPIPTFDGAVITKAQIIEHAMHSAIETELAFLFITVRKRVEIRKTLFEMG